MRSVKGKNSSDYLLHSHCALDYDFPIFGSNLSFASFFSRNAFFPQNELQRVEQKQLRKYLTVKEDTA